jgi:hypothetical protein
MIVAASIFNAAIDWRYLAMLYRSIGIDYDQ